jgi:hypothetical protein
VAKFYRLGINFYQVLFGSPHEYGFNPWTADGDLVRATRDEGCILLTKDRTTINENIYKPCTHGGIIIIENPRPLPGDGVVVYESLLPVG